MGEGFFLLLPLARSLLHPSPLPPPSVSFVFLYFWGCVCKWTQGRVQATAAFDQSNMWEMEHFRNADS